MSRPPMPEHHRRGPDRRRKPTGPWDALRLRFKSRGRRVRPRRDEERRGDYFVDRFDSATFGLALLLLVLSLVDGTLTLLLLGVGCEEVNPAMRYLLDLGPTPFVVGKYLLTAAGLPFLLAYRRFALFRTPLRIGHLIPVFVALYVVLLGYQVGLLSMANHPDGQPTTSASDRPNKSAETNT